MSESAFFIGQIVHHKLFDYRGVIYDVDPSFQGSEAWYLEVARTRPPKDRPWYHVLVDGQSATTYVAERNLERCEDLAPIEHPLLSQLFADFKDGAYRPRRPNN